jgi:hypothetical protein
MPFRIARLRRRPPFETPSVKLQVNIRQLSGLCTKLDRILQHPSGNLNPSDHSPEVAVIEGRAFFERRADMPGRNELSYSAPRSETLHVFRDPDVIATAAVAAIGLLVTGALMLATDGADLALASLTPLN